MPNQDKKPKKKIGDGLKVLVKKLNYDCNEENIDISSKDFLDKYHLVIDGEKITEADLELVIECIRQLRKNFC